MKQPKILFNIRFWFARKIGRRIALAASTLAVALAMMIGVLSYQFAHKLTERTIDSQLRHDATLVANKIELRLAGLLHEATSLARNALVVNALLDSQGRQAYLEPFFRDLSLSQSIPFDVALTDYHGRTLVQRNANANIGYVDAPWILAAVANNTPISDFYSSSGRAYLRLVVPVVYPATNKPEGTLVFEFLISDLVPDSVFDSNLLAKLKLGETTISTSGDWSPAPENLVTVSQSLRLNKPFDKFSAAIAVARSEEHVRAPLAQLALLYVALGLITAGVAVFGALVIAHRLTRPLTTLASIADQFTAVGSTPLKLPPPTVDEVGDLSRALAAMVDRLQKTHDSLEEKVAARTAELNSSETRLRAVLDNIVDGIITIHADGTIVSFNPAAERIFGYSSAEIAGKNVKLLMPAPYAGEHDAYLGAYQATLRARVIGVGRELMGRRQDGSTFPLELAISEINISGERMFTGIVRDITERKQAEQTIRESEERFRMMAVYSSDMITRLSADGIYRYVSPASSSLVGFDPAELVGKTIYERVHPIDIGLLKQRLINVAKNFVLETVAYRYQDREGKYIWLETSLRRLRQGADGEKDIVAVSRDISERVRDTQSLNSFKNILDNTLDIIFMFDPMTLRFSYANRGATTALGYDRDELKALSAHQLCPRFSEQQLRATLQPLLDDGQNSVKLETEFRGKDGREFPIEATFQLAAISGGAPLIVGIARDTTERRKVDRMKNEFVSTVSHELRTPLTSIRGALGLIAAGAMGQLSDNAKNLVDIAYRNSDRLGRLINDILDMEKIESGKMQFDMHTEALAPLLEQSIESTRAYAEQYQVRYVVLGTIPNVAVAVDHDRFMQVMANLLSNAAKFSPENGTVEIAVTENEKGIRITVTDHGSGIPEEFRSKIFQKFSQADSSATRQKGGTGLGLSITKAIIEKMNGSIGFATEINAGTTFYFELPVVASEIEIPSQA